MVAGQETESIGGLDDQLEHAEQRFETQSLIVE
jgi:hypothetical protein